MEVNKNLNDYQLAAINSEEQSVALSAGAGSGKTTVLAARFLKSIERNVKVGKILAITFTEKAARQMREKIRIELNAKAPATSSEPWITALAEIDTATITTFHSFCSMVLRRYAVQVGIDPAFTPLDEAIAGSLRYEAVTQALREILLNDQSPEHDDLKELTILYGYSAVTNAIEQLVRDADIASWKVNLKQKPEAIASAWLETDYKKIVAKRAGHIVATNAALRECQKLLRVNQETFSPRVSNKARTILAHLPTLGQSADEMDLIKQLHETAKVTGTKSEEYGDNEVYEAIKDSFTKVREILKKQLLEAFETEHTQDMAAAALVGQRALRVALKAHERYRKQKRQRASIDFADMITMTQELLEGNPDICSELSKDYDRVMIDECQDTDPIQDNIVRMILGDDIQTEKLFAVGDSKQSIYRFRGAEVALFDQLKRDVRTVLPLPVNYRSGKTILDFVNTVFSSSMPAYEELQFNRASSITESSVELMLVPAKVEAEENVYEREADAITARIHQLVGTPLQGTQTVTPGIIVLLFRRMTYVGVYESALEKAGLDYYTVGGRAFFAQQEVYDLLSLLQVIENPYDAVALVGVLRSPFVGLSDDSVHILATHKDGPWAGMKEAERLKLLTAGDRTLTKQASDMVTEFRAEKDRLPLTRLLSLVFERTGFDGSTQFEFLPDRKLANLWKLLDIARQFETSGLGLPGFITDLADRVTREASEEQAATSLETDNVIRLMTIHQAKGLEFGVVFVPDLNARPGNSPTPVVRWDRHLGCIPNLPPDIEDEADKLRPFSPLPDQLAKAGEAIAVAEEDLRVFYVACTRAECKLVLSAGFKMKEGGEDKELKIQSRAMEALSASYDLVTGLPVNGGPWLIITQPPESSQTDTHKEKPDPTTPKPIPVFAKFATNGNLPLAWLEKILAVPKKSVAAFSCEDNTLNNNTTIHQIPGNTTAKQLLKNVEFSFPLGEGQPIVTGCMDVLLDDDQGWHAIAIASSTEPNIKRLPGLRLGAAALQASAGINVVTLGLFDPPTGKLKQVSINTLTVDQAIAVFVDGLKIRLN